MLKLTRPRQAMRAAAAAGLSGSTLAHIAADDVKAADTDQVRISIDTEGNHKTNVPADWYNKVKDAREASNRIKKGYLNREGVIGVEHTPGSSGGENPKVRVTLSKNSDKKDERRGEIPERQDDTEVVIEEAGKTVAECDPAYLEGPETPGGLRIQPYDDENEHGYCTLSSSTVHTDFKWQGWTTAGHCIPCPGEFNGTQRIRHEADGRSRYLGYVVLLDTDLDIAIIKDDSGSDELSEVASPKDPDNQYWRNEIEGTLSRDGLSTLAFDEGLSFIKKGQSSCFSSGEIEGLDGSKIVGNQFCERELSKQVSWSGYTESGDSGSLVYSEPYEGNRYASHSHSGFYKYLERFGPAGYAIKNKHDVWWDSF